MSGASDNDPLDLDRVDQEIRINQLRLRIEDVAGGEFTSIGDPNVAPELEESFLEHVLEMEEHGFMRPFDVLQKAGVALPAPDGLDAAAITDTLWKLIHACAKHGLFMYHTDHLSDRELYTYLWSDGLREEMMGFGMPGGGCFLDVIGGGSDEQITQGLRFYDSDEDRARWAKDWPDFPIPPREKPPFDRDSKLPQG
jgi:hypothetical protein